MTVETEDRLQASIVKAVAELDHTHALDAQTRVVVCNALFNFVLDSAAKFIAGQKEHGGHITDRDLLAELRKETIDTFWYQTFEAVKRRNG